jgi:hypothetical protein
MDSRRSRERLEDYGGEPVTSVISASDKALAAAFAAAEIHCQTLRDRVQVNTL